jgi:hypothetical protein
MTEVINSSSTATTTQDDFARSKVKQTPLLANLQIQALGRWNQQYMEGVFTRRNGYTSYSLLKMMFSRRLQG